MIDVDDPRVTPVDKGGNPALGNGCRTLIGKSTACRGYMCVQNLRISLEQPARCGSGRPGKVNDRRQEGCDPGDPGAGHMKRFENFRRN
jgi:hypothetical protein